MHIEHVPDAQLLGAQLQTGQVHVGQVRAAHARDTQPIATHGSYHLFQLKLRCLLGCTQSEQF